MVGSFLFLTSLPPVSLQNAFLQRGFGTGGIIATPPVNLPYYPPRNSCNLARHYFVVGYVRVLPMLVTQLHHSPSQTDFRRVVVLHRRVVALEYPDEFPAVQGLHVFAFHRLAETAVVGLSPSLQGD